MRAARPAGATVLGPGWAAPGTRPRSEALCAAGASRSRGGPTKA